MRIFFSHDLDPLTSSEEDWEAKHLELSRQIRESASLKEVAGISFRLNSADKTCEIAGASVSTSNWMPVSTKQRTQKVTLQPPGFPPSSNHLSILAGREILDFLKDWEVSFDALFIDGHGIAQGGLGVAGFVGLCLSPPCVGVSSLFPQGCSQNPSYFRPGSARGDRSALRLNSNNRMVGYSLIVQQNEPPRYVSPGNNLSVEDSVSLTLRASPWYADPEPLRVARSLLKMVK